MVTYQEIERQLRAIGVKFSWWGRGEADELEHIIEPSETIMYCLNGRYDSGFCMLCVTDKRVILIDKKLLYLTIEDIGYDMVSEVDFDGRLLDSTITICTMPKKIRFTTLGGGQKLRQATAYLQRRVMESHKQYVVGDQSNPKLAELDNGVNSFEHRITNPYAKVPLIMRRRVSKDYS